MIMLFKWNIFLCIFLIFLTVNEAVNDPYNQAKCEKIKVQACQGLLYDMTLFPNSMGHSTQDEAASEINEYLPLLRIKCHNSLQLFLCSLYFPVCTNMKIALPPCRSLCEDIKKSCEPILKKFYFKWPSNMACDKYPENNLCIKDNQAEKKPNETMSISCPKPLKVPPSYDFKVRYSSNSVIPDCGIPCNRYFFNEPNLKKFTRVWVALWSFLCVASTLFTVLTFLIDMQRFQYPERPIIFLSACYLVVGLTYVAGFFLNDRVACAGPFSNSDLRPNEVPKIVVQGTKFESCIIMFMLLYFFSMASAIWWVVLTITWYLAAKCHWAHESIERNSQYFHFAAWAIPAGKTIGILALSKVDGDPLTGVCFTGLSDPNALQGFLIAPLCLYLLIGTAFLIAGFVSMFEIRSIIKTGGTKTDKLEKLITRIGIFSVLYIVPAVVVIACYFHESMNLHKWMQRWFWVDVCRSPDYRKYCDKNVDLNKIIKPDSSMYLLNQKPEFELFMIKYLMSLIVGITSGIWIWSGKTLLSWKYFLSKLCGRLEVGAPWTRSGWLERSNSYHQRHFAGLTANKMMINPCDDNQVMAMQYQMVQQNQQSIGNQELQKPLLSCHNGTGVTENMMNAQTLNGNLLPSNQQIGDPKNQKLGYMM
uniref:Fzd-1/2/7 n=1 Tax=Dendrocoelum lacteum TaxID=27895 RepID=T1E112_9PLAT